MRKLVCFFVRGLLGEETCASTFHKGSSLFLVSLKAESGVRAQPQPLPVRAAQPALLGPQRAARAAPAALVRHARTVRRLRLLLSSHGFPRHIPLPFRSGPPASILPKGTGQFRGKAQPALPCSCPVDNLRNRHSPGAPDAPAAWARPTREELPGTPGTRGTTRLTPQPQNYKSQKALRAGPPAA